MHEYSWTIVKSCPGHFEKLLYNTLLYYYFLSILIEISFSLFIYVFFTDPATITTITEKVYKNIGGTAYFECIAIANPMVSNMITWSRESFDMTKTKQTYDSDGKGYLTVTELAKDDSGMFKCTADNRIGEPATREAQLIIMCKLKKHVCFQNLLTVIVLYYTFKN